jgi:hypothetical protein
MGLRLIYSRTAAWNGRPETTLGSRSTLLASLPRGTDPSALESSSNTIARPLDVADGSWPFRDRSVISTVSCRQRCRPRMNGTAVRTRRGFEAFHSDRGQKNRPRIDPVPFSLLGHSQVVAGFGGADGDRTNDLVNALALVSPARPATMMALRGLPRRSLVARHAPRRGGWSAEAFPRGPAHGCPPWAAS